MAFNPIMSPKMVAAIVGEIPWSMANGTKCTESRKVVAPQTT